VVDRRCDQPGVPAPRDRLYGIVVTLPAIGRDLHSSTSSLAWTAAAAAEVEQIVRSSFDHGSKRG
jgi:hypothetical protein